MITKLDNEIICAPSDLELLDRNPFKSPEKGDTFFCHPKDGSPFRSIVLDFDDNNIRVAQNGVMCNYKRDEFRYLIFSVPTNYFSFSKTL